MTTAAAIQAPLVRSSATAIGQHSANVVNAIHIRSKSFAFRLTTAPPPTSGGKRFAVATSTKEEANSKADDLAPSFTSQDDLSFLLKLGAGSLAVAAAIKYGSILVPEITRPNLIQALVMISTPVIVSVLILVKESRVEH